MFWWGCPQKQLIRKEVKFGLVWFGFFVGGFEFWGKSIEYLHTSFSTYWIQKTRVSVNSWNG
jgi:hypothetical protein